MPGPRSWVRTDLPELIDMSDIEPKIRRPYKVLMHRLSPVKHVLNAQASVLSLDSPFASARSRVP